jgi:hypothetical protein
MNTKLKISPLLLIILCLLGGCVKEEIPPSQIGEVVFNADFDIDESTKQMEAGNDNWYMFSSFEQDINGLHHFVGELAKDADCTSNCNEYLKIVISDIESRERVIIEEVFFPSSVPFLEKERDTAQYLVRFNNQSESSTALFNNEWDFNNPAIGTSNDINPEIIVDETELPFKASLKVSSGDGCESVQEQEVKSNLDDSCTVNFTVDPLMIDQIDNEVIFKLNKYPASFINNMIWRIDGQRTPFHSFILSNDLYVILPKVSNAEYCVNSEVNPDCTSTSCRMLLAPENELPSFDCLSKFDYVIEELEQEVFSRVVIEYRDEAGLVFNSRKTEIDLDDKFEIINIESYERNEFNQATIKVDVRFTAKLNAENGESIQFNNGFATFAFAYPE